MLNKDVANEVESKAKELAHKQELLKDFSEHIEKVQVLKEDIKAINEEIKALIAADEECAVLIEEIKAIGKELSQAAKVAAKNTSFKPAVVKAFFKTKVKNDEAVGKVVEKGTEFKTLESLIK